MATKARRSDEFLRVLDGKVAELVRRSEKARASFHQNSMADYERFRDKCLECEAFKIIIQSRIDEIDDPDQRALLQAKLDQATVAVWGTLLDTALAFFRVLADQTHFPLGSREVFMRELKTLYEAKCILTNERYRTLLKDDVARKEETAARILNEVIERAPALLNMNL